VDVTLHLVRRDEPLVPVADDDVVVYLEETGPRREAPITYADLVALIAAARRVITW
jgi:hypothetical protein